jgi:hypothetical protein
MKTAISIPDDLFEQAEIVAKELGLSRSRLVQTALKEFIDRRHEADITRRLNKSYSEHPEPVTPLQKRLLREAMRRNEWDES